MILFRYTIRSMKWLYKKNDNMEVQIHNYFDVEEVFQRDEEGTCKLIHFFRNLLDKYHLSDENITVEEEVRIYEEKVMGISIYIKTEFVNYIHIHIGNNINGIKYQIFEQTLYFHLQNYGPMRHHEMDRWLHDNIQSLIHISKENREIKNILDRILKNVMEEVEFMYQLLTLSEHIQDKVERYHDIKKEEKLSFYTDCMVMNTKIYFKIKKGSNEFSVYQSYANDLYHTYFKKIKDDSEEVFEKGNFDKNSEEFERYIRENLRILFFV